MTNTSKARGTRFESDVVAYLQTQGAPYAERRALAGTLDKGDVTGIPGLVLEAKACKALALAEWLDELVVEMGNANARVGAVVAKRRGKNVAHAYAVMPFETLCELLRDAGYLAHGPLGGRA